MEWLDDVILSLGRSRTLVKEQAGRCEAAVTELAHALTQADVHALPSSVLAPALHSLRTAGDKLRQAHVVTERLLEREQSNLARLHERVRPGRVPAPVYSGPKRNPYRVLSNTLEPTLAPAEGVQMHSPIAGPPGDLDAFLWGGDITVTTPHETPGGDHALAATLCAIAHREPDLLRRMVGWTPESNPWATGRPELRFPGREPFTTSVALPLARVEATSDRQAVGLRTAATGGLGSDVRHENAYGVNYIAKGYAACQSEDGYPRHLTDATLLPERVFDAMTFLTGTHVAFENPALELDDDALTAHLDTAEAIACSRPPDDDEAEAYQLFHGRHAYAVTAASEGQVHLHHPAGHDTSVPLAAFREIFPDLVVGPSILADDQVGPFTPQQLENLAAHLD